MKWRVILDRGLEKDPCVWEHEKRGEALCRAHALCDLHRCDMTEYDPGSVIVVNAVKWYVKPKPWYVKP